MSPDDFDLSKVLAEFKVYAPSGFALGLHVSFAMPAYFFQSYPRPWLAHYSQAGFLMHDPTVRWCFENTGTCRWSDLDDPKGVLAQAADFGMKYGMVYATKAAGSLSMAGFARHDRELDDAEIAQLATQFDALHQATADQAALAPDIVTQLKKMSVLVTHPGGN
jgi:LuxR family transcriptional regulator, quorum-sensing system regulator SdiA